MPLSRSITFACLDLLHYLTKLLPSIFLAQNLGHLLDRIPDFDKLVLRVCAAIFGIPRVLVYLRIFAAQVAVLLVEPLNFGFQEPNFGLPCFNCMKKKEISS